MNLRHWLRDRRALIADIDRQRDLLAVKDEQIRDAGQAINDLENSYGVARDALSREKAEHRRTRRDLDNERGRVFLIHTELADLHALIRGLERGEAISPEMRAFIDADSRAERGED